ncbi:MAG: M48 family metalloprotease [Acidimicrobiales bacterium]
MNRAAALKRTTETYVLLAVVLAVVLYPIWLLVIGPLWAIPAALVVAGAAVGLLYLRSDALTLRALGARPLGDDEAPRLFNLVEGLTVAHGFRFPDLYIVDDGAPNAGVGGRAPKHGTLIVTSGLLDRLDRIQLEAVLTHELMRIRRGDGAVNVTVATVVAPIARVSPSLGAKLAARLVDPDRAVAADLAATNITRYPPALAAALESVRADGRVVVANRRAYRHLWLVTPPEPLVESAFSVDERIAVLYEL